ncbi:MAG TPA: deoxyribonuclease IV [Gemmatimonadales bacterium]|nr:deoxyribonuclease IV [Gemmatimonadales bacterium]
MKPSRPVARSPKVTTTHERLGAHVSTQGGVQTAPARGVDIGATAIQVFTKTPNQWRDPELDEATVSAFRQAYAESGLNGVVAHDSYLINLASPDPALSGRSIASFVAELTRCHRLGIPAVVSHPGNYMDDREAGLQRNAAGCAEALRTAPGEVMVLLETTAGTGTSLGSRFEELAELRDRIPPELRHRIGFCVDTCHMYSAGFDLIESYDAVWEAWDRLIGLEHIRCFHLNDSKTPFDSRRDRHELIAEGSLGAAPFRRIMQDDRFRDVIKVLETPKGDDMVTNDRRMLRRLRAYARGGSKRVR